VRPLLPRLAGRWKVPWPRGQALRVCLCGQSVCPEAELLYLEGVLRTEGGDLSGAHAALVRLLGTQSGLHFGSGAGAATTEDDASSSASRAVRFTFGALGGRRRLLDSSGGGADCPSCHARLARRLSV
jgi:hypothetical protein